MGAGRARHFEFWDLRAVCTGETWHRSDQAGTCQYVTSYWLSEVIVPLGWSKPIDGDEAGSVLTSGYKSIIGLPTAVGSSRASALFGPWLKEGTHSREVDNEDDETELEVERSLT